MEWNVTPIRGDGVEECLPLAALSEGKLKMTRRPGGGATPSRISVLLAAVYDWFTEGFDTAGLKDVQALVMV